MCHKGCEGGLHGVVVLVSSLLIWVCTFGTSVSIGLYNEDLQSFFKAGYAEVSLVGAINLGVSYGAGPFAGTLASNFGYRKIAALGAIISNIGLVVTAFSPSIVYMYFFFGVLNGFGNCLMTVSAQVLCGYHYKKYRGLASSIVLSGVGIGATIFPIIIGELITSFGWKGSLLLLCGIDTHLVPLALLLFPAPEQVILNKELHIEGKTENGSNSHENDTQYGMSELLRNEKHIVRNCIFICISKVKTYFGQIANSEFVIFLLSNAIYNMGYGAVVIFLPQHVISTGVDLEDASLVMMLLGGGLFVGSIISGLFRQNLQSLVYTIGCFGFGISLALLELTSNRGYTFSLSFIAGVFSGFQFAPAFIITCNILGIKAMGIGFGFVMFAVGVGLTAGPPSAGALIDFFGEVKCVLFFNVFVTALSGIFMFPFLIRQIWKSCRKSNSSEIELP